MASACSGVIMTQRLLEVFGQRIEIHVFDGDTDAVFAVVACETPGLAQAQPYLCGALARCASPSVRRVRRSAVFGPTLDFHPAIYGSKRCLRISTPVPA